MTHPNTAESGEYPVALSELLRWTSGRTLSLFFGTAILQGALGACLAIVFAELDRRLAGLAATVIAYAVAMAAGYVVAVVATGALVSLLWRDDMKDPSVAARPGLALRLGGRNDGALGILWLFCAIGAALAALAGLDRIVAIDRAAVDDQVGVLSILALLVVLASSERVLACVARSLRTLPG